MARLHRRTEVLPSDVETAYRLLKTSIVQVKSQDISFRMEEKENEKENEFMSKEEFDRLA